MAIVRSPRGSSENDYQADGSRVNNPEIVSGNAPRGSARNREAVPSGIWMAREGQTEVGEGVDESG